MALPGDPQVMHMASSMATALQEQSRVKCGFASVADVTTGRLDDRMDSYFLSETLVYLYLTIMPAEELKKVARWPVGGIVFSTEGHMFPLPSAGDYKLDHLRDITDSNADLYPDEENRPLMTCDSISPLERVAVQGRCRTKYILTPNHQLQSLGYSAHLCRPQDVRITATVSSLQSRSWKMEGMSASFGLPLAAVQSQSVRPQSRGITSTGTSVLDFLRPPGQMPAFSEGVFSAQRGSGWYAARELLASRKIVLATPEHACTALLTEKTSNGTDNATAPFMESPKNPYEGRAVVVSRGDCLFLQKLTYLQQVKAAIAIVVNTEKHTDLQVMSCPLQDRGSAKSVHTPSVMVSFEDGETLRWLVRTYGDVTVKVVTRT
eukprot:TRINITY_DN24106_c0_g1_i1.p1 TRINITY_DN24106_c0_g1~~TRINITY_DN24106_c0_g1_i1.p1  ORF type:complete len:377 (+),score=16.39 TRINITY_DN24106_c0_g1_i1:248-1378(+)